MNQNNHLYRDAVKVMNVFRSCDNKNQTPVAKKMMQLYNIKHRKSNTKFSFVNIWTSYFEYDYEMIEIKNNIRD